MIPFSTADGLRDWRADVARTPRRWPWLLLITGVLTLGLVWGSR